MSDSMDPRTLPGGDAEGEMLVARLLRLAGPRPEAPPGAADRVRLVVRERWREARRARARRTRLAWITGSTLAAAAALALVAVGLRWQRSAVPVPDLVGPAGSVLRVAGAATASGVKLVAGAPIAAGTPIETGAASRAALELAGKEVVRLDATTRILIEDSRSISLERGRLYVDAGGRGDGGSSLAVRTSVAIIRDIGTRFEVSVEESGVRVRVRDGKVQVKRAEAAEEVLPGQALSVGSDGALRREASPVYGEEWDWILDASPGFSLEGKTLGAFLGWFSAEMGLRVEFEDETTRAKSEGIVLHGSIDGIRPDRAPEAVLPACGLASRVAGETLKVRAAAR